MIRMGPVVYIHVCLVQKFCVIDPVQQALSLIDGFVNIWCPIDHLGSNSN